jgi:PAS domain S-box-containing protein
VVEIETGIIVKTNEEAERLLGIPSEQMVGMHCSDLFPEEEREEYHEVFQRYIGNDKTFSDQFAIFDRNSSRKIPVSIRSSLVEIKGKQYIIGSFREQQRKSNIPNLKTIATGVLQRRLTGRECEVVQLIATGHTSRQIAARLSISEKTVETHRTRIMKKLNFHRIADLVRYAISSKLIE